nr:Sep4a [Coccidioides posadasii]AAW68429.1 Sep4a [Coccidioides posadasii]
MAHRGRYSYASSAVSTINSPRRVRRRKDPTPYNILVIGARNSGKTSFVNFLRKALALPPNKRPTRNPEEMDDLPQAPPNGYFTCHYLETEIDSERVGLTLWDSQGLERSIVDLQLREITGFLESKFEDSFTEEMKVIRSPGVRDTHIHCAFLILDPARLDENIAAAQKAAGGDSSGSAIRVVGGLDEDLDLQVLRTMQGKTTVVPVISKADTVTTAHMAFLKKTVWDSLKKANIDPLEVLTLEEHDDDYSSSLDRFDEKEEDELREAKDDANRRTPDSETVPDDPNNPVPPPAAPSAAEKSLEKQRKRSSSSSMLSGGSNAEPFIPLSILSPDPHSLESKDGPIGRKFPWGFADPYDPEHCDFLKLKDTVFGEWRGELREASREVWYERWRTIRLKRNGSYGNGQA